MHVLAGVYLYVISFSVGPPYVFVFTKVDLTLPASWEFAMSLDFDWAFISGTKTFRWPLVCHKFFCRTPRLNIYVDFLYGWAILPLRSFDRHVSSSRTLTSISD